MRRDDNPQPKESNVDPNATLRDFHDAIDNSDWTTAVELGEAILAWIRNGGFRPDGFTPLMFDSWLDRARIEVRWGTLTRTRTSGPESLSDDSEFSDPDRPTDSELATAAGWDTEELAAGNLDDSIADTLDAHESLDASLSDLSDLTGCVIRCQLTPDGAPGPYLLTVTRRADGPDRWIVEGPGGFSASIDGDWIRANREPVGKSGPGVAQERPDAPDAHSIDPAPESRSEGNVDDPKTVPYGWREVGGSESLPVKSSRQAAIDCGKSLQRLASKAPTETERRDLLRKARSFYLDAGLTGMAAWCERHIGS
jgi:hypothetical protein